MRYINDTARWLLVLAVMLWACTGTQDALTAQIIALATLASCGLVAITIVEHLEEYGHACWYI